MTLLNNIFKQIDDQTTELSGLLPLKSEDQLRLDKKFRLEFNYNSNHLEGNTLTYGETELLLIFEKTRGDHEKREYDEMSGHDVALKMIEEEAKDAERPLTEQFIRLLNEQILVRPFWKNAITPDGQQTRKQIFPGQYKTSPNSVVLQNGEIFEYSSPADTPLKMQELVKWYNENSNTEHPLLLASLLHYRFVRIHPFDDGNGRVSRLLMNYVLLKNNLPMVVIKSDEKKVYLNALNKADTGDTQAFVEYIGEQLLWSLDLIIKAAKGEDLEETNDWIKEIELIKRKVKEKSNIGKSPNIVYRVFKNCRDNLWPIIKETSSKFNDLFNETKTFNRVNYNPIQEQDSWSHQDSWANMITSGIGFANKSIFGYDPYKENVYSISWEEKKYALRGAKKLTDYSLGLTIKFDDLKYTISIEVNNKNIMTLNKSYNDPILKDEIDDLNSKLKTVMVKQIKRDTNN